jgi:hypothetical protein
VPGLGVLASRFDDKLLVAQPDPSAGANDQRTVEAVPTYPGAKARSGILEDWAAVVA